MGNWFTGVFSSLFGLDQEFKIILVGLDSAGKTTILYKMKLQEF